MRAEVKYIAIIDTIGKIHYINLQPGVNVITGKSSTGKSAILEIFDYCFGSSDSTIPEGVITDNANIYFIVIEINGGHLVLGRSSKKAKHYISFETDDDFINNIENFSLNYFEELGTIPSADFKKELNKYFGIDIEDVDEDLEDRKYRKFNSKKAAPSYRHFTSFILQHQNLIANKHALFYRFDEKEKKDQTIEQFKIFLGLVDAGYYPLKQQLAEKLREKKNLEGIKDQFAKVQETLTESLSEILNEFEIKTNKSLFAESADLIIKQPKKYIKALSSYNITFNQLTDENVSKRNDLQRSYNEILSRIRKLQNIVSNIDLSIYYANDFAKQTSNISILQATKYDDADCVFCGSHQDSIHQEQNKLQQAINWFNAEMDKSAYTIQSFVSDKKIYEGQITELKKSAYKLKTEISVYDKIITDLNGNRSIEEQALKLILKVETLLETVQENSIQKIQDDIDEVDNELEKIERQLTERYDVTAQLLLAARKINQEMNLIGKKLAFEDNYKQKLNLKFDTETFELYQQEVEAGKHTKKIYLRSMGSGANWLHSHVSLFAALLYYFCSLGNKCKIPTFLFIDQPSQVYFPSEIDKDENFDGKKIKQVSSISGKNWEKSYDDDLQAVTMLFQELYNFCEKTFKETKIRPQIIITDHADNLKLEGVEFESLVRARWRGNDEGFVKLQ